jgi:hypothetical protein
MRDNKGHQNPYNGGLFGVTATFYSKSTKYSYLLYIRVCINVYSTSSYLLVSYISTQYIVYSVPILSLKGRTLDSNNTTSYRN